MSVIRIDVLKIEAGTKIDMHARRGSGRNADGLAHCSAPIAAAARPLPPGGSFWSQ